MAALRTICTISASIAVAFGTGVAPVRADDAAAAADRFDTVVIDAGHGGDDHGAEGPAGLREKDLVLDLARRLKTRLAAKGVRVVLTRETDVYVPLDERTAIANRARGDLFVSIHANGASARRARGVETFFVALEASDEATRKLAERENAAFREAAAAVPDDPIGSILGDLAAADQMRESDEFARIAHKEVSALDASIPARGVKQAPFVVLMGVEMPAALIEVGFITNPEDERDLASEVHRERLADALGRAILGFAVRFDARRGVERPARGRELSAPAEGGA